MYEDKFCFLLKSQAKAKFRNQNYKFLLLGLQFLLLLQCFPEFGEALNLKGKFFQSVLLEQEHLIVHFAQNDFCIKPLLYKGPCFCCCQSFRIPKHQQHEHNFAHIHHSRAIAQLRQNKNQLNMVDEKYFQVLFVIV